MLVRYRLGLCTSRWRLFTLTPDAGGDGEGT
jgi:hypothetical protein